MPKKIYVKAKELEEAANDLADNADEGGCYHWKIANKDGKYIAIVLGWSGGWDKNDPDKDKYQDGEYRLAVKIAYQPDNSIMQCDYEIDWTEPWYDDTGDLAEVEDSIYESTDFKSLADTVNRNAAWVLRNWKEFNHD